MPGGVKTHAVAAVAGLTLGALGALVITDRDPGHAGTAIAAGAAAIVVALITAITTDRRLDKQLEAESARQLANLKAERDRETARRLHERELKDLEAVRSLIDDAWAQIDEITVLLLEIDAATARDDGDLVDRKRAEADVVWQRSFDTRARLSVRLGENAPLVELFRAHRDLARKAVEYDDDDDPRELVKRMGAAARRFREEAHRLAGLRLPEDPTAR